jgi:membrane-bound lytic murein transglycosylase MltF
MLLSGAGDIVAAGLPSHDHIKQGVSFTHPYNSVKMALLSLDNTKEIKELRDLAGLTVAIKDDSHHRAKLEEINHQLQQQNLQAMQLEIVSKTLEIDNIIELVALGRYDFTVADSHIASNAINQFPELRTHPFDSGQSTDIAWAVHPKSKDLLSELNQFMPEIYKAAILETKKSKKRLRSIASIKMGGKLRKKGGISRYDHLFKKYAKRYGWDWKLITALAYQESRFRQNIKNRWGAIGVLQVK